MALPTPSHRGSKCGHCSSCLDLHSLSLDRNLAAPAPGISTLGQHWAELGRLVIVLIPQFPRPVQTLAVATWTNASSALSAGGWECSPVIAADARLLQVSVGLGLPDLRRER